MAFDNAAPARAAARRTKKELILGIGGRAFVNWRHSADTVPLMVAGEQPLPSDMADGEEVIIISWRPRSLNGLAYQIRRVRDGSEWWILAAHLRRRAEPDPPAAETPEVTTAPIAAYRSTRSSR